MPGPKKEEMAFSSDTQLPSLSQTLEPLDAARPDTAPDAGGAHGAAGAAGGLHPRRPAGRH